jgi:hypothetical protein
MTLWKMPPITKIYEAFTAVADGRVQLTGTGLATVASSRGDKVYDVEWSDDAGTIAANDNASYWQGYVGYPIVAVLLARGVLHADEAAVTALHGFPWHDLNKRYKRDYDAAVAQVLRDLAAGGTDAALIEREAAAVLEQLADLGLQRVGRGRRPPAPKS